MPNNSLYPGPGHNDNTLVNSMRMTHQSTVHNNATNFSNIL